MSAIFPESNNPLVDRWTKSVQEDIQSDSFALQDLFFDINRVLEPEIDKVLNLSTPDRPLFKFIEEIDKFSKIVGLTPTEIQALNALKGKLEKAKILALAISAIILAPREEEKEKIRKYLQHLIINQIVNMEDGEDILVPAGFMSGNIYDTEKLLNGEVTGHSLLLKFAKRGDKFTVTVYNTGQGDLWHEGDEKHKKAGDRRLYPLVFENVDPSDISMGFVEELTKFSYNLTGKKVSFAPFYTFLELQLGTPRKPDPSTDRSYSYQYVKNCTKKCLQAWAQEELHSCKTLYQRLRRAALEDEIKRLSKIMGKEGDFTYEHPLALREGPPDGKPIHINWTLKSSQLKLIRSEGERMLAQRISRLEREVKGSKAGPEPAPEAPRAAPAVPSQASPPLEKDA